MRVPCPRFAAAIGLFAALQSVPGTLHAQTAPAQRAAPPTVKVGDRAPEFTLAAGDGKTYSLAALHGKKPLVLVVFRGTW